MIEFDDVSKTYPNGARAIEKLSLTAQTGKLTVLVGPSGCGKTTSLRMVNRLIRPSSGTIRLNGDDAARLDETELRRRVGYVIQHVGLFPHRTVEHNVAVTARLTGKPRRQAVEVARELLERVGLGSEFFRRYPWQLSGGQQQRVGVARALAAESEFMLMDEPFSAVDPVVRSQLQDEFLRLQREFGKTIVMVTHDVDEALRLGDRIAVFREGGHIAQFDTPEVLLTAPKDDFVATFLGSERGYRSLAFRSGVRVRPAPVPTVTLDERSGPSGPASDEWRLAVGGSGRPIGWLPPFEPVERERLLPCGATAGPDASLRDLLNAALSSPSSAGLVLDDDGGVAGVVPIDAVLPEIAAGTRATSPNEGAPC
ncbi:ABC transporter ATP-binding protein [Streptomyces sp. NPDC005492]|uniref:ABC transporter ATP-binding protein n=1 Tax=Streptomyces sp. NPDC005492 TaxID=3156883 RepID=UPI0033AEA629